MAGGCRKIYHMKIHNLYSSQNIKVTEYGKVNERVIPCSWLLGEVYIKISPEKLKGRENLGDLGVDGIPVLK
jgi:hypothetical protein